MRIAHVLVWLGGAREKNWEARISDLLAQRGHAVVRIPFPRWPKPYHEYDLVFASHHMAAPMAQHLAEREGAKFVAQVLDVPEFRLSGEEPWASNLRRYLGISLEQYRREWGEVGEALREAHLVLSISNKTARDLKATWGIDSVVNPLGVDCEVADRYLASNPVKRDQFCALGNLYDHKRFDLLVRIFNELGRRLVLMGDGYMMPELREMAGSNIILTGAVTEEQKYRVFQRSQALIHASVCEGQPLLFAEALYSGLPVISYDLPAVREVYESCGSLFLWHTKQELIEHLQEPKPGASRDWVIKNRLTLQDYVNRLERTIEEI